MMPVIENIESTNCNGKPVFIFVCYAVLTELMFIDKHFLYSASLMCLMYINGPLSRALKVSKAVPLDLSTVTLD